MLLIGTAYFLFDLAYLRAGAPHPLDDIWEDGLIARELIAGGAFRTSMIYPPLWGLHDPATMTVPVLVHGPLLPLTLVGPIRLWGDGVLDQLAWLAAAAALVTAVLIFRLAARNAAALLGISAHEARETQTAGAVGAAAAFLFLFSPLTLEATHHSLSVLIGALGSTGALALLDRDRPRTLAAGLVLGLTYLVRPEMLLVAPILALLAAWRAKSLKPAAAVIAGFVVAALPWWWHLFQVIGSPFFNLTSYTTVGFWETRPEATPMRDFALTPEVWPAVFRREFPAMWPKWVAFFPHAAKHAAFTPTAATGLLALVGLILALRVRALRPLAVIGAILALIPIAGMTLTNYQRLYITPFLPLYAIAAAWGAARLAVMWPALRRPAAWLILLGLLVAPSTITAVAIGASEAKPGWDLLARERADLARFPSGEKARRPMFSDRPSFVAWTLRRPALWLKENEYRALPAADGSADSSMVAGRPPRRDPRYTWFHDGHWAQGHQALD